MQKKAWALKVTVSNVLSAKLSKEAREENPERPHSRSADAVQQHSRDHAAVPFVCFTIPTFKQYAMHGSAIIITRRRRPACFFLVFSYVLHLL